MEGFNYFYFNIYTDFMVVMLLQAALHDILEEKVKNQEINYR